MADGPQVVILAAGLGTRMRSSLPKVLHPLGGQPLIWHVIDTARAVSDRRPVVVVNPSQGRVRAALDGQVDVVEQQEAHGTGAALRSLPQRLRGTGATLVLSADVPLVRPETLRRLVRARETAGAAAAMLTAVPEDPSGLGRVVRDPDGHVLRVVEERDLSSGTGIPGEVNAGVYVFNDRVWAALEQLSDRNSQSELYLTDVIELLAPHVQTVAVDDPDEVIGINDRRQLATAEAALRRRTLDVLMTSGVTVIDPATTYIDSTVRIGADSVIHPMTTIRGCTVVGRHASIGPSAVLRDVTAGERVTVAGATLEECELGDEVVVGPYCRVRPGTVLRSRVELGTHAEVKNSTVGERTHINHFSCVLDSDVGSDVNVGAGAVTCNFDGQAKHRTVIGDRVFVGTNATLVAPVRLGDDCYIAAGSVVTQDVPGGALAVGRGRQRNVEGWAVRRGRGTA